MAYTYDQFVSSAQRAGMMEQFSTYDLDMAKQYPEFGLSMLTLKQDYAKATTPEAKALANTAANNLRSSYGNYTGGSTGSGFVSNGLAPSDYNGKYDAEIADILGQMGSYGDFSYGPAPTYDNQYSEQQQALLDEILNRPDFAYDKNEDPSYGAYKKEYLREGERASANALGQAAAMSGGMLSSNAVTAATQAGDYYAGQLSDKIPELRQQAYQKYLDEYTMKRQDLGNVNTQEQMDYGKYLDSLGQYNTDRALTYDEFVNKFNRLGSTLGGYQGQDATEYGRLLDQIDNNANNSQMATAAQSEARAMVDNMLAAGSTPSAQMIAQAGYPQEYVDAMKTYYAGQKKKGEEELEEEDPVVELTPEQQAAYDAVNSGKYTTADVDLLKNSDIVWDGDPKWEQYYPGASDYEGEKEIEKDRKHTDEQIAAAAAQYFKTNPNVLLDSRTLDYWLADNGYSGTEAQLFKAYGFESYGAKYSRKQEA